MSEPTIASDLADDVVEARIYMGIHFRFAADSWAEAGDSRRDARLQPLPPAG